MIPGVDVKGKGDRALGEATMSNGRNDTYMDIVAIVMAALIVLFMFSMTGVGATSGMQ